LRLGGQQISALRVLSRVLQTSLILLDQALWVLQQAAHLGPDRQVHQIGTDLRVVAESVAAEAVGVAADAAVIRVVARVVLGRARADLLPIVGVAAQRAADQSL